MAERYVASLLRPPSPADLAWLVAAGQGGELDASRALASGRRAIGLIVAERDALDDQTAADVSHALTAVVQRESRQVHSAAADWSSHWRDYADALAIRGRSESPMGRIARVLLRHAGIPAPRAEQHARAVEIATAFRHEANEALSETYGAASLPEDRSPSELLRERSGHG